MGTVAPDLLIETRLRAAITAISRNSAYLDDALSRFDEKGAEQVRAFFRGRKIPVLGGWPTTAQQVPCITVQLRPSQEAADLQPINASAWGYQENSEVLMYSTFFRTTIVCTCYGNNQTEATILALVVKWVLLVMRHQLEFDGLLEQTLGVSDFEPIPSMFDPNSTAWFLRSVNLTVTHEDKWNVAQSPLIASILVSAYDDREE